MEVRLRIIASIRHQTKAQSLQVACIRWSTTCKLEQRSTTDSRQGGSRDERYNLSFIVENSVQIGKPIIGVSIAYRLSAWGFLQSQEVTGSGNTNMGLRDQRLALHWLQENIAAVGGDPAKVTIWGEVRQRTISADGN